MISVNGTENRPAFSGHSCDTAELLVRARVAELGDVQPRVGGLVESTAAVEDRVDLFAASSGLPRIWK